MPTDPKIKVGFFVTYLKKPPSNSKAVYLPPGQKGLTGAGIELRDSKPSGAILLSQYYVDEVGELPKDERVATLLSNIRHELKHAENFQRKLVAANSDVIEEALDETIAHSENILNTQLGPHIVEAPLWDQIDHLTQAESYFEQATNANGPLHEAASNALDAARTKLMKTLKDYTDEPEVVITNYLNASEFADKRLESKSAAMAEVLPPRRIPKGVFPQRIEPRDDPDRARDINSTN